MPLNKDYEPPGRNPSDAWMRLEIRQSVPVRKLLIGRMAGTVDVLGLLGLRKSDVTFGNTRKGRKLGRSEL